MITPTGGPLMKRDLAALAARWIDPKTAATQFLRRVHSLDGAEAIGRNGSGDYAGMLIPNIWPGSDYIREYRLRRDHPEIENGKLTRKYLAPPGLRSHRKSVREQVHRPRKRERKRPRHGPF
ncbi:MAG TPA: hypothetical protein VI455_05740 [Terriglobia bacterium]